MDNDTDDFGSGAAIGDGGGAQADMTHGFFGSFRVLSPGVEIFLGGRPVNGMFAD